MLGTSWLDHSSESFAVPRCINNYSQHEAGELIAAGCTEADLVELGQLYDYAGDQSHWTPRRDMTEGIRASGDVTIFKSVGVGVQDVVIACAVVQRAVEEGIGHVIEDYDA